MPPPGLPIHLDEVRAQVALGVVDGLKLILADEKLMESFWHQGYTELATRSTNGASMWFGKRLMVWLVVLMVAAGLTYLARTK